MTTSGSFNPLTHKYDPKFVPNFRAGLELLSQDEKEYIKHLITPEAAFLLAKAFGPEMDILLWPFITEDGPAKLPETSPI